MFIPGYVLSTALSQIQGSQTRTSLRVTAEALFPAAQHSQKAASAFERMVKGFGGAVIMQDAERAAEACKLASPVDQMLAGARSAYGVVMAGTTPVSTRASSSSIEITVTPYLRCR